MQFNVYWMSYLFERSLGTNNAIVHSNKHTLWFHQSALPQTLDVYPRPEKQTKSIIKIHYRLQTMSSNKDVNAYTLTHTNSVRIKEHCEWTATVPRFQAILISCQRASQS